jgi:hypothetical protein
MTVAELISVLQAMPQGAVVITSEDQGGYDTYADIPELTYARRDPNYPNHPAWLRVWGEKNQPDPSEPEWFEAVYLRAVF